MTRPIALALALALAPALVGVAAADDPLVCVDEEDLYLFACAGGGVDGSCDTAGYRFNEVVVATLVAYVVVIGDSMCSQSGASTFEDNSVIAAAGTDVVSASAWWYWSHSYDPDNGEYEGCRFMTRVYSALGPILIDNRDCPAGLEPPRLAWGELVP